MRMRLAAIAALLGCATAAHAGTMTLALDFSALAPYAGQDDVAASFTQNGFVVTVYDAMVIGPDDAYYAGAIGVIPQVGNQRIAIAPADGLSFPWVSISGTFAAASGSSVLWSGEADWSGGKRRPFFAGKAPGTYAYTPGGAGPPIAFNTHEIDLYADEAKSQLIGLTITLGTPAPVPEPHTALLGGLATVLLAGWIRVRARAGRASGCRSRRWRSRSGRR